MRMLSARVAARLVVVAAVVAAGTVVPGPAQAATEGASTRYLLSRLQSGSEHPLGYERSLFRHWSDADGDGCSAREEILISEAVVRPRVGAGCELRGGRWYSRYDGLRTVDPSTFDVDHMIPLNEAWQSGAWRWSPDMRQEFANDLGYAGSLIAVSASSNRSKGDREPQDWLPTRAAYACKYVARWVAVKWRWALKVNPAERSFLTGQLEACGWPLVARPSRAGADIGSGGSGGAAAGLDPRFPYCYVAVAAGFGPYVRGRDQEYDWYEDRDGDGVVCET